MLSPENSFFYHSRHRKKAQEKSRLRRDAPVKGQIVSGFFPAQALTAEAHRQAALQQAVIDPVVSHGFGIFQLLKAEIGGDHRGRNRQVPAIDDVEYLLPGKVRLSLHAEIIQDQQLAGEQLDHEILPVLGVQSNQTPQDHTEGGAADHAGCNELFRRDIRFYDAFFAKEKNQVASTVANTANNAYIQASGDNKGIASYGMVATQLVSWYLQETALPDAEENPNFDPLDKDYIDGILGDTND